MLTRVFPVRAVAALAAVPVVLAACTSPEQGTTSAPETESAPAQSAGVTPMSGPIQAPAAPAPPACGAGSALLASMSTRDKLAQLLMVGVRNASDARAVVGNQHVGGIMIGSWTDLSMLTDGTIAEISNLRPVPLAVSVDEEGGRVSRLKKVIGEQLAPRELVAAGKAPPPKQQVSLVEGTPGAQLVGHLINALGDVG